MCIIDRFGPTQHHHIVLSGYFDLQRARHKKSVFKLQHFSGCFECFWGHRPRHGNHSVHHQSRTRHVWQLLDPGLFGTNHPRHWWCCRGWFRCSRSDSWIDHRGNLLESAAHHQRKQFDFGEPVDGFVVPQQNWQCNHWGRGNVATNSMGQYDWFEIRCEFIRQSK